MCVCLRIASAHATKDGDESDEASKDDDWASEKKGRHVEVDVSCVHAYKKTN